MRDARCGCIGHRGLVFKFGFSRFGVHLIKKFYPCKASAAIVLDICPYANIL
ncbi:MAG: hypothetical protein ACI9EH_001337, partial [Planktomarina sp.]